MTDLDPAIWDNPTLGAAAGNENLDRLTKQQLEDRAAKLEGREPREVVVDNTYPGWTPDVNERTGTVPSNYQTVHFADENPNDIPVDSAPIEETAGGIDTEPDISSEESPEDAESSDGTVSSESEEEAGYSSVETPVDNSTEEGNSTQWT